MADGRWQMAMFQKIVATRRCKIAGRSVEAGVSWQDVFI